MEEEKTARHFHIQGNYIEKLIQYNYVSGDQYLGNASAVSTPSSTSPTGLSENGTNGHVAKAIREVMEQRDEKGNYLFTFGVQWQGIYRVLADRGMVKAGDYAGFGIYIDSLHIEGLRVPLDAKGLSKTDCGVLAHPLSEWDFSRFDGMKSTFERYEKVALAFAALLPAQMP